MQKTFLVPTGHLGFTPFESASFDAGLERTPDYVVADSGSCDIGPNPLGSDQPHSPRAWQRLDVERMLLGARRLGVPMIIGSASDTGTDIGVEAFAEMVRQVASEYRLEPFKMATIYSEVPIARLEALLHEGRPLKGLHGVADADAELLARTDRAVAVMGAEPFMAALEAGADVIIAGRSCDSALFAGPALFNGFAPAQSWYAGKVLECSSFCAEPYAGKESVFGTIRDESVTVEAMHPAQRCTPLSLAGHAMYERIDPYFETVPGGVLDMSNVSYRQVDARSTEVTGMRWTPQAPAIKIEGAGKVGERAVAIMGVRDPITLGYIDEAIAWARAKVTERLGAPGARQRYDLYYHVFGRDAVMGYLEPDRSVGHEVGIVVEAVAPSAQLAEEVCALGSRNLFYARLPVVKGTAGAASFWSDEILRARPGYTWTLNHAVEVTDPMEFVRLELETVGAGTPEAIR